MFQEIGPVRPFAPAYGLVPTMTMKYRFNIDGQGNLKITSQLTSHPHKGPLFISDWKTEVNIEDNIPIPREMLSVIHKLLEESDSYFVNHWKFVIEVIEKVKRKSSEVYIKISDLYVKTQSLQEEVELLREQNAQLRRHHLRPSTALPTAPPIASTAPPIASHPEPTPEPIASTAPPISELTQSSHPIVVEDVV